MSVNHFPKRFNLEVVQAGGTGNLFVLDVVSTYKRNNGIIAECKVAENRQARPFSVHACPDLTYIWLTSGGKFLGVVIGNYLYDTLLWKKNGATCILKEGKIALTYDESIKENYLYDEGPGGWRPLKYKDTWIPSPPEDIYSDHERVRIRKFSCPVCGTPNYVLGDAYYHKISENLYYLIKENFKGYGCVQGHGIPPALLPNCQNFVYHNTVWVWKEPSYRDLALMVRKNGNTYLAWRYTPFQVFLNRCDASEDEECTRCHQLPEGMYLTNCQQFMKARGYFPEKGLVFREPSS